MRAFACTARSSPTWMSMSSSSTGPSTDSADASTSLVAWWDSTAKRSQSSCISVHMARSLADAFLSPLRPVAVISGSRLAMLTSFMLSAEGVRSMALAIRMISGFFEWSSPNGTRQYKANATSNCWRVQRDPAFTTRSTLSVAPRGCGYYDPGRSLLSSDRRRCGNPEWVAHLLQPVTQFQKRASAVSLCLKARRLC